MYHVYLLQSKFDQTYYIGQTDNISNRIKKHNAGLVLSTKAKRPWKLIGYEEYLTRNEARWREYKLKHNISEKKRFINKLTKDTLS